MFFLRRAAYLERSGDAAGAEAARALAVEAGAAEDASADHFLEGERAYQHGDDLTVVAAFRRLLVRDPGHFWGRYLLVVCHLERHRPAEAQAEFSTCQAIRPDFAWCDVLKGLSEREMGQRDRSDADFRRATELDPDHLPAIIESSTTLANPGVPRPFPAASKTAGLDGSGCGQLFDAGASDR